MSPSDAQATYTIGELATAAGMTVRNIRAHQSRGLLPPPLRRGRVAYYRPSHLERLRAIIDLQRQGFNLVAIAAIFASDQPESRSRIFALPPGDLGEIEGLVRTHTTELADNVVAHCLHRAWRPYAAEGYPVERWEEVRAAFRELVDRVAPAVAAAVSAHVREVADPVGSDGTTLPPAASM